MSKKDSALLVLALALLALALLALGLLALGLLALGLLLVEAVCLLFGMLGTLYSQGKQEVKLRSCLLTGLK